MDKIAVLIPCYNEEKTIKKVVEDFKKELPEAKIYVYDNNSTDKTVELAKAAGAIVRHETRQGKGKGNPEVWVAVVKEGKIMFEIGDVSEDIAREALRLASHKLPIKTKFVKKESGEK